MPIYNAPLKEIDQKETRRYAGLNKSEFNSKAIADACTEVQLLAEAKGIWQLYDYIAATGKVAAVPPASIEGTKIRCHLALAEKVIFMAVTIGDTVEEQITAHFQEGKYSHSLLLDAAATTAVEQAADAMEKTIRQKIVPQGYEMLWRFSPGYGDWDIHFQPEMIRLSQATNIGISLTESMMLLPRKSITAVIGLVPNQLAPSAASEHNCQICSKTDCLARKK